MPNDVPCQGFFIKNKKTATKKLARAGGIVYSDRAVKKCLVLLGMLRALGLLLEAYPAFAQPSPQNYPGDDAWNRIHAGPHAGIYIAPAYLRLFEPKKDTFGVAAGVFFQFGIKPWLDLRAGLEGDATGSKQSYLAAALPVGLRFNLGPVYSLSLGGAAGIMTDTLRPAFFAGPELSLLGYRFGALKEFELRLDHTLRFHLAPGKSADNLTHIRHILSLSYTYFDHRAIDPRFSSQASCVLH